MNSKIKGRKIIICISGLAGSGKSTLARRIARHYGLKFYSGGDALKAVASEMGYSVSERGWWETEDGLRFIEERLRNLDIDKKIDEKMMEWAREGDVVLDSWTMPWLLKEGFKIWLDASEEVRAARIAKRDKISFEEALKRMKEREARTKEIYRRLYGFKLGEDFRPFHVILDVNNLNEDEAFETLRLIIDRWILKEKDKSSLEAPFSGQI